MPKPVRRKDRKPFITGSQVYGCPDEESDIDLVVCMDESTAEMLREFSDTGGYVLRFGSLNLIAVTPKQYDAWLEAKEECINLKASIPKIGLSKRQAIAIHEEIAEKHGLEYRAIFTSQGEKDAQAGL